MILDEAQNATDTQIKMFLTRLGKNTTMVVNGDPSQIDLPGSKSSGLLKSINILDDIDEIKLPDLTPQMFKDTLLYQKLLMLIKKSIMHKIHISCDSKIWLKDLTNVEKNIKNILKKSIMSEKKFLSKNIEISVLLTNTKKMTSLNYKYRNKKKDTDILSFPSEKPSFFKKKLKQKNIYLGDLALSFNI